MNKETITVLVSKLDNVKKDLLFPPNTRFYDMFSIAENYANGAEMYNATENKLKRLGFRFAQTKGTGKIKISVRDTTEEQNNFLLIF